MVLCFRWFLTVLASQGPGPPFYTPERKARYSLFYRGFRLFQDCYFPVLYLPGWLFRAELLQSWALSRGKRENVQNGENEGILHF